MEEEKCTFYNASLQRRPEPAEEPQRQAGRVPAQVQEPGGRPQGLRRRDPHHRQETARHRREVEGGKHFFKGPHRQIECQTEILEQHADQFRKDYGVFL